MRGFLDWPIWQQVAAGLAATVLFVVVLVRIVAPMLLEILDLLSPDPTDEDEEE
jgi:hypothetical protein